MVPSRFVNPESNYRSPLLIGMALATFLGPLPSSLEAQIQADSVGVSLAWQLDREVPPGTVTGVVLGPGGIPYSGAQVHFSETTIGALTDHLGRFTLVPPSPGRWEIQVSHLGFRTIRDTLVVPSDLGVTVAVLTLPEGAHICGTVVCAGTSCRDLHVTVVDSITGASPETPVTLRVEHADGAWENTVTFGDDPRFSGWIGLGRDVTTVGPHTISVSAPGYRTWRIEDVHLEVEVHACVGVLKNRGHRARLVPIRDAFPQASGTPSAF
jgi:hypothetical protein